MRTEHSTPQIQPAETSEYHVASFVAHVVPEMAEDMIADINSIEGAEIHAVSEQGKVVFTVEAASQSQIGNTIDQLKHHIGLLSLSPVYHQFLIE